MQSARTIPGGGASEHRSVFRQNTQEEHLFRTALAPEFSVALQSANYVRVHSVQGPSLPRSPTGSPLQEPGQGRKTGYPPSEFPVVAPSEPAALRAKAKLKHAQDEKQDVTPQRFPCGRS